MKIRDGKPEITRLPKLFFDDDLAGKPLGIDLFIGKRPYAAFGNSTDDREMLEWTAAGDGALPLTLNTATLAHHLPRILQPNLFERTWLSIDERPRNVA